MAEARHRVCPVEHAGSLDNRLRRWLQNPRKILGPYLKEGIVALDLGCGPGFFAIDMAQMVGQTGKVIACDLQEGMLGKLQAKIQGTPLEERIQLHQCESGAIGWPGEVDFILAFYMMHELPDQTAIFNEMASILKADGLIFMVEPPFHVSRTGFSETLATAVRCGFRVAERPKVFLSKAVILRKSKG